VEGSRREVDMDFEVRSGRSLELVALSEVVQPILHYLICLRGICFESKSIPKLPRQYPWAWAPSIPQREQVKIFQLNDLMMWPFLCWGNLLRLHRLRPDRLRPHRLRLDLQLIAYRQRKGSRFASHLVGRIARQQALGHSVVSFGSALE